MTKSVRTILHITPHLGGGVGRAVSALCTFEGNVSRHKIVLLDAPEKRQFVDFCAEQDVPVVIQPDDTILEKLISEADIVQVEWWNHPLTADFLVNSLPSLQGDNCRLLVWSHISGCNFPFLPYNLTACAQFVATAPHALENPWWSVAEQEKAKRDIPVVHSSGGAEKIGLTTPRSHKGFVIGYVGTLTWFKLHHDIVDFCAAIKLPEARFVFVGDPVEREDILSQAAKSGISEVLEFAGYAENVEETFSGFDVFGYPLNPYQSGTTENALLEAMAAGLCPVCLRQNPEKNIIRHKETGLLVDTVEEYGEAMRYLYDHPEERRRMGIAARADVLSRFSLAKTAADMENVYNMLMRQPKKKYNFADTLGTTPVDWFLTCLSPEDRTPFLTNTEDSIRSSRGVLWEPSKSSIPQFSRYFSDDKILNYWVQQRGIK